MIIKKLSSTALSNALSNGIHGWVYSVLKPCNKRSHTNNEKNKKNVFLPARPRWYAGKVMFAKKAKKKKKNGVQKSAD